MSARFVSSTLIKNVSKGGKSIAVEYVDKTTAWVRPEGFPSNSVKEEFAEVAIANVDSFKPDATRIAMKESEHQSDKDARVHYTAYGLNNEGKVIDVQHLVKDKK